MKDFQKLQDDIKLWSDETFGYNRTAHPMIAHLKKEIKELDKILKKYNRIIYCSSDDCKEYEELIHDIKMEYADCFMLLIDSAAHFPLSINSILESVREKLEINKNRKWGKPDKNGVIEHIR